MLLFNQMISDKYGDSMTIVSDDNKPKVETVHDDSDSDPDSYVPYEDDAELPRSIPHRIAALLFAKEGFEILRD
jgi:hypothetical protein